MDQLALQNHFAVSNDFVFEMGINKLLNFTNQTWNNKVDSAHQNVIGQPFIFFVHPEDRDFANKELDQLCTGSKTATAFEFRLLSSGGDWIWLTCSATISDGSILAIGRDCSAIKEKNALLEAVQEHAKIGGWTLDVSSLVTFWTDETYNIHEVAVGTPTNTANGINFYHPADRNQIIQCVNEAIAEGTPWNKVLRIITAKNNQKWVKATGFAIRNQYGKVVRLQGTFQDVTESRTLEIKLQENALKFSNLLENVPCMVYTFQMDPDGSMYFPFASKKTFEIYEIQPEDFKNEPSLMLTMVHTEDQASITSAILSSAENLSPFNWKGRIITKSGKTKWIHAQSIPTKQMEGSISWDGVVVEFTQELELQKVIEEQRLINLQTAKLASIGELAAGVGHEINNPLAVVMGLIDRVKKKLKAHAINDQEILETFERLELACFRIKHIVNGLRTFARTDDKSNSFGDLNQAVSSTISLLGEIFNQEDIKIDLDTTSASMAIKCDTNKIQQVIMNLLSNAKDAIRPKKVRKIAIATRQDATHATLLIQDNGTGIPKNIQDKLFTTFFTTKPAGEGTGLGLALSKSIVETAGGRISFTTEEGVGTTFIVKIPLHINPDSETKSSATTIDKPMKSGSMRILVVDDDPDLREVICDYLHDSGHNSQSAANGFEALELFEKNNFDVLITDLKMPGMDGFTLLKELESRGLGVNTVKVLSTGNTVKDVKNNNSDAHLSLVDFTIAKPFTPEELDDIMSQCNKALGL